MLLFELTALLMIGIYIGTQPGNPAEKRRRYLLLVLTAFAGWLAEESSIRLYGFYYYSPTWRLFIIHLPLLVVAVWPVVIHSAWDLASQLLGRSSRWVAPAAAGIILADAALIEVIAVQTGWWSWTRPGVFQVPPIGILGWSFFAFFCALLFQRAESNPHKIPFLLLAIVPALGTHLLLLAAWWALLRWVSFPIAPPVAAAAAWAISLTLVCLALKKRPGRRIKARTLLWRFPAALFFYVLLIYNAEGSGWLVIFSLAFAPSYLILFYDALRQRFGVRHFSIQATGK